jgi:regulator of sirC expression with transglutaminase-like and TPR domain
MFSETKVTWEKLCFELDLLLNEEPAAVLPIVVGLNQFFSNNEVPSRLIRQLNFMTFDLSNRCQDKTETERFEILNRYFFAEKGFQVLPVEYGQGHLRDYFIDYVLENRQGAPIAVSLVYLYLAQHLELPISFVNHGRHSILKWVRAGKALIVDLSQNGTVLDERELIELLRVRSSVCPNKHLPVLHLLKARDLIRTYTLALTRIFARDGFPQYLHETLNVLLRLDENNLRLLGERALVRKDLGLHKEAFSDLKRYFSFADQKQAPRELKLAFYELQMMNQTLPKDGRKPINVTLH